MAVRRSSRRTPEGRAPRFADRPQLAPNGEKKEPAVSLDINPRMLNALLDAQDRRIPSLRAMEGLVGFSEGRVDPPTLPRRHLALLRAAGLWRERLLRRMAASAAGFYISGHPRAAPNIKEARQGLEEPDARPERRAVPHALASARIPYVRRLPQSPRTPPKRDPDHPRAQMEKTRSPSRSGLPKPAPRPRPAHARSRPPRKGHPGGPAASPGMGVPEPAGRNPEPPRPFHRRSQPAMTRWIHPSLPARKIFAKAGAGALEILQIPYSTREVTDGLTGLRGSG